MAWNPYFPQNYQYQMPQQMTPPTIRAEIVQVDGEQAARAYPVGAGASQMMMARDDSAIYVKTALQNGQCQFDVYARQIAPIEKPFDPTEYVRRDEIAALIADALKEANNEHL